MSLPPISHGHWKLGKSRLEYDAGYETVEEKRAATLLGEYPILVRQFEKAGVGMLEQLGSGGDSEMRLFCKAIREMRSCSPTSVAFLAKLKCFLREKEYAEE